VDGVSGILDSCAFERGENWPEEYRYSLYRCNCFVYKVRVPEIAEKINIDVITELSPRRSPTRQTAY